MTDLRDRIRDLVEMSAPPIPANSVLRHTRRPRDWGVWKVAVTAGLVALLVGGITFAIDIGSDGEAPVAGSTDITPTTSEEVSTAAATVGEPELVQTPFVVWTMHAVGTDLYVTAAGPTDRVMRSTDGGSTWEQIVEADPGDSEGLFAAGYLVVLVVEDDRPARNTEGPSSVVTQAPRVFIYDPTTSRTSEVVLPRPADPVMEGLGELEDAECGTFGYQSLIGAEDVAVGERLLVTGSQTLVGRLEDGTILCPDQAHRVAWTSDDGGTSWELHEDVSAAVHAVSWTGSRFVAWSTSDGGSLDGLVVSSDGLNWTSAARSSLVPSDLLPSGFSVVSSGETVLAAAGVHGWAAQIPDGVTDPEQLRDVLRISDDADVAETLAMLGVDLPLDPDEVETIARFNGSVRQAGAVVGVSRDGGLSWTVAYVPTGVSERVGITAAGFVSATHDLGDPADPSDETSSLYTSQDGINWVHALDLPYGAIPVQFTATGNAVYLGAGETEGIWIVPINR